jgi:hypothetical protein
MAPQKVSRPAKSITIDVVAHPRLEDLQKALGSQNMPRYVEYVEIISALVMFTTPEQLAGMLRGYWQYIDALPPDED